MKIFFKAGNSANVGLLIIRLALGSMFLLAGAKKVFNLKEFIESVQQVGKMDDNLAFVLAFILPFMELLFGALYIIGLFTPITSLFIAIMSISFLLVLGPWHSELPFSYNFIFLACAVATLISGAGKISFDALVDKDSKKVNKNPVQPSDNFVAPVTGIVPETSTNIENDVTLKSTEDKN